MTTSFTTRPGLIVSAEAITLDLHSALTPVFLAINAEKGAIFLVVLTTLVGIHAGMSKFLTAVCCCPLTLMRELYVVDKKRKTAIKQIYSIETPKGQTAGFDGGGRVYE